MTMQTARFDVKPDCVAQFEDAVTRIVEALKQTSPDGVRYTVCRSETGTIFMGILRLDAGIANPLPALPEGQAFLEGLGTWLTSPPERAQWSLLSEFNAPTKAGGNR